MEAQLRSQWRDLLGHNNFGLDDNFYDLGGHSLHLGRLHATLVAQGYGDLTLVELFQFPTIRTLARRLDKETEEIPTPTLAQSTPASEPVRAGTLAHQRARRRQSRQRT